MDILFNCSFSVCPVLSSSSDHVVGKTLLFNPPPKNVTHSLNHEMDVVYFTQLNKREVCTFEPTVYHVDQVLA